MVVSNDAGIASDMLRQILRIDAFAAVSLREKKSERKWISADEVD